MTETHEDDLNGLLNEIIEKEKKSRELYEAAERQLSYAISAYIAPPRESQKKERKNL